MIYEFSSLEYKPFFNQDRMLQEAFDKAQSAYDNMDPSDKDPVEMLEFDDCDLDIMEV